MKYYGKYYILSEDIEQEDDIKYFSEIDDTIPVQTFLMGKKYNDWDGNFCFYYDETEGNIATDFLANDRTWFIVSARLREILESMNTEIQFLPVKIIERRSQRELPDYYIANILRVVDALCLKKSEYFKVNIKSIGTIYSVVKYGIFAKKTKQSDVFKLANRQEIPIFVSEHFKDVIESKGITGIKLQEIRVYENELSRGKGDVV